MKLVDYEIADAIETYKIITPYVPCNVQPNSVDIRLGNSFLLYEDSDTPLDVRKPESFTTDVKLIENVDTFELKPGQFVLGETLEWIKLPEHMYAELHGKSSLARLGISVHQTGGLIDSGFEGTITLEIKNVNNRSVILQSGMTIGQLTLERVDRPSIPYNCRLEAKYMFQQSPTPSRYKN